MLGLGMVSAAVASASFAGQSCLQSERASQVPILTGFADYNCSCLLMIGFAHAAAKMSTSRVPGRAEFYMDILEPLHPYGAGPLGDPTVICYRERSYPLFGEGPVARRICPYAVRPLKGYSLACLIQHAPPPPSSMDNAWSRCSLSDLKNWLVPCRFFVTEFRVPSEFWWLYVSGMQVFGGPQAKIRPAPPKNRLRGP